MKPSRIALVLALLAACSAPAPLPVPPEPIAPRPGSVTSATAEPAATAAPGSTPAGSATAPKMPPGWPYAAPAAVVASTRGMVSSDAQLGTKVGQEMLAAGGNAVDAAVATAFALAVVMPSAGNIGGGGFMVARIGDKTHALDFREKAPGKATATMFLGKDGKPTQDARSGYLASGVPGSVAGLFEAHKKLGSKNKSWKDVVAPAIKLARDGFTVDENFAKVVSDSREKLSKYPATAALYLPGGNGPAAGTVFKNPDLAATLERIAEQGPPGFYAGKTAELIVAEMKRGKGLISAADLKAYEAKWRDPIEFTYRGQKVLSMPPPSSGGVTLGIMCGLLEGFDIGKKPFQSPEHLQPVFEAMRRAFAARNATLGDPDVVKNPVEQLLSKAWLDQQRATITPGKATPSAQIGAPASSGGTGPHTTHFSVVDDAGNAVALTTTVNHWFGNGVTVAGAGFVMNNEMDDFAVKAGTPNSFGLVQGEPNLVGPNKRMLSSMTPTIVLGNDGKVQLVTGAAGGPTIITAVFQILSNMVDFGLDPVTAVNAPRFHQQHMPDLVVHETSGVHPATLEALVKMGYEMKERGHLADAPSIGRGSGGWIGAAEPRRRGAFAAGW